MKIEQIYTGCLAQGAYYIECDGEAAIIDPLREISGYLKYAERDNAKILYVLETHFHADFVSGHIDLAKKSGATIILGPTAQPGFSAHVANDGEVLRLGSATIQVLHTPGHTMESACFLLRDSSGKDIALFSGDTLFIGDVGRPDLAQKAANMTREQLAGLLFHSLRDKIMPLADDIIVYPGHGAGSACGKNMSKETTDTLGHQKATNYALRADMTEPEFVAAVTEGLTPPPAYFPLNAMMNRSGYESLETVLNRGLQGWTPEAFEAAAESTGALLLDTRDAQVFARGFVPGSINIGIDGNFAPWVGALVPDIRQQILIVAEPGREAEVVTRLARVGYDFCIGYLEGGMEAWTKAGKETDHIISVTVEELDKVSRTEEVRLIDVRKKSEYDSERIRDAVNMPLDCVNDQIVTLDNNETYYVYCAAGYRSMIFISILKARGFDHLIDIKGGFKELKASGLFPVTDYVCPTTML